MVVEEVESVISYFHYFFILFASSSMRDKKFWVYKKKILDMIGISVMNKMWALLHMLPRWDGKKVIIKCSILKWIIIAETGNSLSENCILSRPPVPCLISLTKIHGLITFNEFFFSSVVNTHEWSFYFVPDSILLLLQWLVSFSFCFSQTQFVWFFYSTTHYNTGTKSYIE